MEKHWSRILEQIISRKSEAEDFSHFRVSIFMKELKLAIVTLWLCTVLSCNISLLFLQNVLMFWQISQNTAHL